MMTIREYKRAESLEEAWQLNQKKPNRILGGMIWLKMDGLKTAMRIKEKYPKLPVVLVTAYMNYALDGYKVKASRFLLKDNLADTIEECMDDLIAEINKNRRILVFTFTE